MHCREDLKLWEYGTTQDIINSRQDNKSEALTSLRCPLPSCPPSSVLQLRCQTKGLMWLLIGTMMPRPASDVTRPWLNLHAWQALLQRSFSSQFFSTTPDASNALCALCAVKGGCTLSNYGTVHQSTLCRGGGC